MRFRLSEFDRATDKLVRDVDLPFISENDVREYILIDENDRDIIHIYDVPAKIVELLRQRFELADLDPARFDYQIQRWPDSA